VSSFSTLDAQMMSIAIKLAEKGIYTTTPNPNVGCVIVSSEGQIVGQGWHQKAGTEHAEVHALKQAGAFAKGSTAYVTLEPCSHYGRTAPCAEALIKAGVTRVVAAMIDPNPLVAGKGLALLEAQGIKTSSGLLESQARLLNPGFIKRMQTGMPRVTVKLASSLDGKTALHNGQSQWITGPKARQDVQRHRAKSCAILSGSGTVMADNPSLNVRFAELGDLGDDFKEQNLRQPLRVLLDGRNQLSSNLKLFGLPGKTLVVNKTTSECQFPDGVQQWQAPAAGNKLDLNAVIQHLGDIGLNEVWVEAGARLAGALLQEKLIDELILYQAPKLMGEQSQGLFQISPLDNMHQVYQLAWKDVRQIGEDLKITAQVRY
jgi:diaminohydroxyphosphoribosylaminopyrimidine deaminase/5-amino-6-(5-phosphoribosylamino)uracil reductase